MSQISVRDPEGFVLELNGNLYRIIFQEWEEEYKIFLSGDLDFIQFPSHKVITGSEYDEVLDFLISINYNTENIIAITQIERLEFISYPWEWTPNMLIDAALLTLKIQKDLTEKQLTLKDASFFNVQFLNGSPVFIDLLSIKQSANLYPWNAYGQFLRHFVHPIILLKYHDSSDLKFLWQNIDGLNIRDISSHIGISKYFNLFELMHLVIGAKLSNDSMEAENSSPNEKKNKLTNLSNLLDWNISYLNGVKKKRLKSPSFWLNYYNRDVQNDYYCLKVEKINYMLQGISKLESVLDVGANTGEYSELYLNYSNKVISLENDVQCCELIHDKIKSKKSVSNWYVVHADITNLDPSLGWLNKERKGLINRITSQLVSLLGVIHHLYFTNSIDFDQQVLLYSKLSTDYLLVEFISDKDDKVKIISKNNPIRLRSYSESNFISSFEREYVLLSQESVSETRKLFLFRKNVKSN